MLCLRLRCYVCKCNVVLDEISLFVFLVCAIGVVIMVFFVCFRCLCDFVSCNVMMLGGVLCVRCFIPRFCF